MQRAHEFQNTPKAEDTQVGTFPDTGNYSRELPETVAVSENCYLKKEFILKSSRHVCNPQLYFGYLRETVSPFPGAFNFHCIL